MINMPPSYGKTEIIARSFIAWNLGKDRTRKFFYISYSDELGRRVSKQVRELMQGEFYKTIFEPMNFLNNTARGFVLREGGGLFVTTLKSALTGFHADQILIDDPIKVSEMTSKAAVNLVNQNFKESVLSRLQNNYSNITILMQRLGLNDLCGFLTSEREFEPEVIKEWKVIKLKALNEQEEHYKAKDFTYIRKAGEALFSLRHDETELEELRLKMGNDEFSAQYLQEPIALSGGYFDETLYKNIFLHELNNFNAFIFIDNAMSLSERADNRAIIVIACDRHSDSVRYCVLDCFFGIWSEEETIDYILQAKEQYKDAKVFIESDGGGLVLNRLLMVELAKYNTKAKYNHKPALSDDIQCYTPSRKVSKVQKIKAMRPYYNTGFLVFSHACQNQTQIKKELFSFNPDKPFRQDDCIDAIASALQHESVKPPQEQELLDSTNYRHRTRSARTWRI